MRREAIGVSKTISDRGRRQMGEIFRGQFRPQSDNRISKIKVLKWVRLSIFVFVLVVVGPMAAAQKTEKILRIGYLDNSTASGSAVLVEAFRKGLLKLGWIEGKNIAI